MGNLNNKNFVSEDWKDDLDYQFNLGIYLTNWALKSLTNNKA